MGSYETSKNGEPVSVSFTDADTAKDISDLLAVLPQDFEGSASTEWQTLDAMLADMQSGKPLSDLQWGVLKLALQRHAAELAKFRASNDDAVEGYIASTEPGTGRLSEGQAIDFIGFAMRLPDKDPLRQEATRWREPLGRSTPLLDTDQRTARHLRDRDMPLVGLYTTTEGNRNGNHH